MVRPFDPTRCPIPPIARIPTTPLIVDPGVPEPPPEILDCLDPITPLPAEPETPCPDITAGGSEVGHFPIYYTSESVGTFRFRITRGAGCSFDIDAEIALPCAPLTTFGQDKTAQPLAFTTYTSASAGNLRFVITPGPGCDFDVQATMSMASPGMVAVTEAAGVGGRVGFTLGFGFVALYRLDRFTGVMTLAASHVKVYNNMTGTVGGSKHVQLLLVDGALVVSAEECPLS